MYNGRTKQMCHVHVELIASVQDQPERRGATSILGGNSLYTARFGYLANLKELVNVLPPCEDCETTLLAHDDSRRLPVQMLQNNLNRCTDCAAWSFDEPKRRLLLTKPKPDEKHTTTTDKGVTYDAIADLISTYCTN